jgi:hypothetical protein
MNHDTSIIAEFKIRPDRHSKWRRKGGYFVVLVVKSVKDVREIYGHRNKRVLAFVHTGKIAAFKGRSCLGWIIFPKKIGNLIVTHEATHAALYFLSWQLTGHTFGRKVSYKSDEQICELVGTIASEITKGLYRKGVWK